MDKKRGGNRKGAGRKPLSGPYKEKTVPIRVPVSKILWIKTLLQNYQERSANEITLCSSDYILCDPDTACSDSSTQITLPHFEESVSAGAPVQFDNEAKGSLNLFRHLVDNPDTNYVLTVSGDSMVDAGIFSGDLVIVDNGVKPKHNDIVVACIDSNTTLKRFLIEEKHIRLKAENEQVSDIIVNPEDNDVILYGVVTSIIRKIRT